MTARPNQLTPLGEWSNWLVLAGRGFGKTRTGGEDVAYAGITNKNWRIAIVAPTFADARDTCVEGESGLLSSIPPTMVKDWNRSIGELFLTNGTVYRIYTAEKPDRLRGPQHHRAWCDEVCSWKYPEETYDMLQFGLRLGENPQSIYTTTPKPIKLLRDLLKDPNTVLSSGSTYENKENLPESFFRRIIAKYEGSRLGLQELYAKVLDDIPGALWTRAIIEAKRISGELPERVATRCSRVVVAIDPAVTSGEESDETGISVVGMGSAGNSGYVFADASCREKALTWGRVAIDLYYRFRADCIVGEVNNGGDLVEDVIKTIDPNIPFRKVHATRGKFKRAEPISTLYEQGRISHVGLFEKLEDQMCMFVPDTDSKNDSPDRADAMVWGFTELFGDCMNLGLLEFAKLESNMNKMEKATNLIKPEKSIQMVQCPECESFSVGRVGGEYRCNQCGQQFGGKEIASTVFNRDNIHKLGGLRGIN